MSTDVQTVTGKFVWHDHGSPEPAKARELYGGLFGWEFETFRPGEMNRCGGISYPPVASAERHP
jgi:predicted enzyme related to lactoylglutathione lyase